MEIRTYLEKQRKRVDDFLAAYFQRCDIPEELRRSMAYSVFAGGKRIRPVMAIAAFEACGGAGDQILPVAAALEMIHTYSLVHDDLPAMDDDDLRRGRPTNHKVFGEAGAILAGDGLLTEAFEVLSRDGESSLPGEARVRIIREISGGAGARGMVAGQLADIQAEGTVPDRETLREIHRRKTGALITASVVAGGIAAGAGNGALEGLRTYGAALGLAFQVTDDILDVTRSAEELGKSTSDQERGKATYPALYGLDGARAMAEDLIGEAVGALRDFGPEADSLRQIAGVILSRTH